MQISGASIPAELIYDAVLDDDTLQQLPAAFEKAYGARSCTLHWRHEDGGAEILSHSNYFSPEHMITYAEHFTSADLWTLRGSERSQINRIWNCNELVPDNVYEKSIFYNDWIRAMGDDTYYCMGTVMETRWGNGIIGLHRGKTQSTFEEEKLQALRRDVVHLRRMLAIRGRLAKAEGRARSSNASLDILGEAIISVTVEGRVLHANRAAEEILKRDDGISVRNGCLIGSSANANKKLAYALARALDPTNPEATAVAVARTAGGRYDLSIVAMRFRDAPRQIVITLQDPDFQDATVERRLRDLYRLTPAEAYVARRLSEGATVRQLAEERGVALCTIQVQVKSVTAKLGCSRQAEVVQAVTNLPRIAAVRAGKKS